MPVQDTLLGARVICEGKEPIKADLFFVHGLSGHPIKTWSKEPPLEDRRSIIRLLTKRNKAKKPFDVSDSSSVFWPRDLLPADVPNVRIVSYGYQSEVLKMFAAANKNNIFQHAQNMLADIQRVRSENPGRKAIFICHSLGGILTKETLRLSRAAIFQPSLQSLYKRTCGVIFLGTPHRGSAYAPWGALMGNLAKLALQSPNTSLLKSLEVDSMALQMIADEFSTMIREDIAVYSFREERGMSGIYGLHDKIVDDFSSIIGDAAEGKEGIDANHSDMCKFFSREDNGYRKVSGEIQRLVNAVSNEVPANNALDTENWPDFILAPIRRKILRDKPYNHLNFEEGDGELTLKLPVLDEPSLTLPSSYELPRTMYFGSSVFELADVLCLLPGQANSHALLSEQMSLAQVITDERTYYSRISQRGLLRLVCQHFYSISDTEPALIVRTNIGTFEFVRTENGNTVRFLARERSAASIAPREQDFDSLQKSALGEFCLRKDNNANFFNGPDAPTGAPRWISVRPRDVVSNVDLYHCKCIRFMTATDYAELMNEEKFASRTLELIFEVLEQHIEFFDEYTQQGLGLVKILSGKVLSKCDTLATVVSGSKWVLSGLARKNVDESPSPAPENLATTALDVPEEISREELDGTAKQPRKNGSFIEATMRARSSATVAPRNLTNLEKNADALLKVAAQELSRLEALNRVSSSEDALRSRIEELGLSQLDVLATLAAIQIVCLANAKIIKAASVPAPSRWLQLLNAANADILIG